MKFLFLALILFFATTCLAQRDRLNLITGGNSSISFPMIGVLYQLDQTQVGATVGPICRTCFNFELNPNAKELTISVHFYKHLFGTSALSSRKPWFAKIAGSYSQYTLIATSNHWHFNIQFGRDFNITKRLGLAASLGPHVEYLLEVGQSSNDYELSFNKYPSLDIHLFYRFHFRE